MSQIEPADIQAQRPYLPIEACEQLALLADTRDDYRVMVQGWIDGVMIAEAPPEGTPATDVEIADFVALWTSILGGAGPASVRMARIAASPARPLPSLWRRAWSFGRSLLRHVWHGLPKTPEDLRAERIKICGGCEHLRPADLRCGLVNGTGCGCDVRLKSAWLLESCPAGKWPALPVVD